MIDVLVVGAGPAGAVAATVLARAGVSVQVVDRARFPRDKFCGDTLNPGVVAILDRLGLAGGVVRAATPIDGMIVTGPGGVRVCARYRRGRDGRALLRRDLDAWLLQRAMAAGARAEEEIVVRAPIVGQTPSGPAVRGVTARGRDGRSIDLLARLTIAADGRRSRIVAALRLGAQPPIQRWAVGGYFTDVAGLSTAGEMHVRKARYIGVAPIAPGVANVCVVTSDRALAARPAPLLEQTLKEEPELRDRFDAARLASPVVSMGPMARDVRAAGMSGLLLAGDAAGFIDPMTGDGLRFAIRGGELAAQAALGALAQGRHDAHRHLARTRAREFGRKWRLNQALRALVGSPHAVSLATLSARVAPWVIETLVRVAGDEGVS